MSKSKAEFEALVDTAVNKALLNLIAIRPHWKGVKFLYTRGRFQASLPTHITEADSDKIRAEADTVIREAMQETSKKHFGAGIGMHIGRSGDEGVEERTVCFCGECEGSLDIKKGMQDIIKQALISVPLEVDSEGKLDTSKQAEVATEGILALLSFLEVI